MSSNIMISGANACQPVGIGCSTPRSFGAGTPVAALSTHFPSSHSYGYAGASLNMLCLPSLAKLRWYLLGPALPSFATQSCFAWKSRAHLPWCARSAGRPFAGWPSVSASPLAGRSRLLSRRSPNRACPAPSSGILDAICGLARISHRGRG